MPSVVITAEDRKGAEEFLEAYLSEALPEGDFSKGSFLRDLTITAIAHTVAYLRKEGKLALDRASVRRILAMAPGQDRDEAADDALSNWFLTRKAGRPSRGKITVYTSAAADVVVPVTNRFYYDSSKIFVPDYPETYVIPATELHELRDGSGVVRSRFFYLNVVASESGADYDVAPATWLNWDRFSPYITRVESTARFVGGKSTESTDDFLDRASDAVSTRDLTSVRAIRTVLKDLFATVEDVVVVGAGDAEMQRDAVTLGSGLTHTGGVTDIYLHGPVVNAPVYEATVGAAFTDPGTEVTSFSSAAAGNFETRGVAAGMVLRIHNAQAGEPTQYLIRAAHQTRLSVSSRTPFPDVRTGVDFSIGAYHPDYVDVIPGAGNPRYTDGAFTRTTQLSRRVPLPQLPIYRIRKVSYFHPTYSSWLTLTATNTEPDALDFPAGGYRLYYTDPQRAYSERQVALLAVGSDAQDGWQVRVEYDTVDGFDAVHAYVADAYNRVACADVLTKALVPVYVRIPDLTYALRAKATAVPVASAIQNALADFINTFPTEETLTVAAMISFLQTTFPQIGGVSRFTVYLDLLAPDGRTVTYSNELGATPSDTVVIASDREPVYPPLLPNPLLYGISERTVRYVTAPDLLNVHA